MSESLTMQDLVASGHLYISDGYRTKKSEHGRPGIPILRVAEVLDGSISPTFEDYVSENFRLAMGAKISEPGDVVLTTKGTVGRVAIMPEDFPEFSYSPQVCFFRLSSDGPLDRRYLYYWFKSDEFWRQASSRKGQTDMADYINLADIRSLKLLVPPKRVQQAIAAVLGALDDKIAVNERIAATALELADAQFYEAAFKMPLSSQTFGSLAEVAGGGTPSTKVESYWGGSLPWATPSDVTALSAPYLFGTSRTITQSGLDTCASRLYPALSIFMTSRATIGSFALPQVPTAVNQGFIVVLPPTEELRWWLLHEMRSRVAEMISISNGSTFLELSRKNFKEMRVRLAAPEVLRNFAQVAASLHGSAANAAAECRTLATLRDTLLPKLMSGQLTVRQAESLVEDVT